MSVILYYVDESHDAEKYCLVGIGMRHSSWRVNLESIKQWRKELWSKHGVYINKELHAVKLTRGRGRPSNRFVSPANRIRIYESGLELLGQLNETIVIPVAINKKGCQNPSLKAWDRLLNRIETNCRKMDERELEIRRDLSGKVSAKFSGQESTDIQRRLNSYSSRAMVVPDEGQEKQIRKALRKMHIHNYIPSQFNRWQDGESSKNIPVMRVIEDPVFRSSHESYLIQMADFAAYALLKSEVEPTSLVDKYELDKMFERHLKEKCLKNASRKDPRGLGIVRN